MFLFKYFSSTDWLGWLIFIGSFYYIGTKKNLDLKSKVTLSSILFIHQVIALYYFLAYPHFVEGIDFTGFHLTAKTIAEVNYFSLGTDAALFSNLLALFYKLNSSQLLGQELAVCMFMASCFVFMRIIKYYKFEQYLIPMLLIYALCPASLLWTSVILREPFEITFLMLAFECLLYFKSNIFSTATRLSYLGCAVFLIFYTCLLHKGLFFCLPVFLIASLIIPIRDDANENIMLGLMNLRKMTQYVLCLFITLGVLLLMTSQGTEENRKLYLMKIRNHGIIYSDNLMTINVAKDLISKISSVGLYKAIVKYRYGNLDLMTPEQLANLLNANTNYDQGSFVPANIFQFGYMSLIEYAHYAFLPATFVTGKWSFMNWIISLIYFFRLILFCSALSFSVMLYKRNVRSPIILFSLYFIVSYIFALGTTSYGTAMRHNLMTDWIIILLGTPLLYNFIIKLTTLRARLGLNIGTAGV